MKHLKTGLYPVGRLRVGAAILAAAAVANITLVRRRVLVFTRMQRRYEQAHGVVETAVAQLRACHGTIAGCDAKLNASIDGVAGALAADGEPRRYPFAALGLITPSDMKYLKYGEKAKAVHQLVAAVRKRPNLSTATRRAASVAEEAARLMGKALLPVEKLQANLKAARVARELVGKAWDKALVVLKLDVRAAAADSAPGLDEALFGRNPPKPKAAAAAQKGAATGQNTATTEQKAATITDATAPVATSVTPPPPVSGS